MRLPARKAMTVMHTILEGHEGWEYVLLEQEIVFTQGDFAKLIAAEVPREYVGVRRGLDASSDYDREFLVGHVVYLD